MIIQESTNWNNAHTNHELPIQYDKDRTIMT